MSLNRLETGHDGGGPEDGRATMRRMVRFVRPYRWRLAGYAALLAASSFAGIVPPLIFKALLDTAIPHRDVVLLNLRCPTCPRSDGNIDCSSTRTTLGRNGWEGSHRGILRQRLVSDPYRLSAIPKRVNEDVGKKVP
ncbi:hypothetical protein GCM10023317_61630 [Actinopolymorpha pittospori]|uniref:ABC-type multidrug transport system fused ATPase/permease subunit n=1 Tax=Actinopolymorpha pittospori TaxID=648752 RepID=A0A927REV0_9ACTN|nr:ABC-type multidrug transport system fused ATPase/permease subunit [Actinopolymorpha pittospori]